MRRPRFRRPPLTGLGWALTGAVPILVLLSFVAPRRLAGLALALLACLLIAWVFTWSAVSGPRDARRRVRRGGSGTPGAGEAPRAHDAPASRGRAH